MTSLAGAVCAASDWAITSLVRAIGPVAGAAGVAGAVEGAAAVAGAGAGASPAGLDAAGFGAALRTIGGGGGGSVRKPTAK